MFIVSAHKSQSTGLAKKAEAVFQYSDRNQFELVKAKRGLALAKAIQGNISEAEKIWPESNFLLSDILTGWGDIANFDCNYDLALKWYNKVLEIDSGLGRVWFEIGNIKNKRDDQEQALDCFDKAIDLGYEDAVIPTARILRDTDKDSESISVLYDALKKFSSYDKRLNWYYELIDLLQIESEWEKAIMVINEGVIEYPENPWLHIQLGRSLYFGRNEFTQAILELKEAISLDYDNPLSYKTLGDLMMQENKFQDAYYWYSKAIAYNQGDVMLHVKRANALRNNNDFEEALLLYMETADSFPNAPSVYYEISWLYHLLNEQEKAIDSIEKAINLIERPKYFYYLRAGIIYESVGENDKAINAYKNVLTIDKDNQEAIEGIMRLQD